MFYFVADMPFLKCFPVSFSIILLIFFFLKCFIDLDISGQIGQKFGRYYAVKCLPNIFIDYKLKKYFLFSFKLDS